MNSLYRIGGIAALVCALMYLISSGIYVPAYRAGPPPSAVLEWYILVGLKLVKLGRIGSQTNEQKGIKNEYS